MIDKGHEETERLLERTEKEVQRVYKRAGMESRKKLNEYLAQFKKDDDAKQALVKSGEMTEEAYVKWRKDSMLTGKRFQEMLNTLADDYVQSDLIAMSIVNGHLLEAYAINRNFAAFQVESGSLIDTSFTLYSQHTVERLLREHPDLLPRPSVDIPKDRRWNRRKIREEITQGILQGESIPKVSERLKKVTGMNNSSAVRNARTAITGAQNAGRVDSYRQAQEMGIDIMQEWLASMDSRTRHSHVLTDGERINVGGKFSNGCRYPGDPQGPASEIYNCRCTLIPVLTGFSFTDAPRDTRYAKMSYEEWTKLKEELSGNES